MSYQNMSMQEAIKKFSDVEFKYSNQKKEFEHFLWHEKHKGRIYQLGFTDDDIKNIEKLFDVKLSDYKDHELNINSKLSEYIKSEELENKINGMCILKEYIQSRRSNEFIANINMELVNEYNQKLELCEKLPKGYRTFCKIILN